MYCLVAYTEIKEDLSKYLRARINTYHWIVGTIPNQNCWFIWHHDTNACFSLTKIGKFLYRNKGKFTSQYYLNKGKPPVGNLYAYAKNISETDMIRCVTEKDIIINEDECCFPSHFDKGVLQQCFDDYLNAQRMENNVKNNYDATTLNQPNVYWSDLDTEIENAERYVEKLKQTRRERDKLILKTLDVNEMIQLLDS